MSRNDRTSPSDAETAALLTVDDVAARLQVSKSCVYRLVETRRLPHHRIGTARGAIRFSESDIRAFLDDCRIEPQLTEERPKRAQLKHLKL